MHIVTLPDQTHFDYLMYVFHKHVTSGIDPEELAIAGKVWGYLKSTQELDPTIIEGPEVVRVPGPISIVHNGDVSIPVSDKEQPDAER